MSADLASLAEQAKLHIAPTADLLHVAHKVNEAFEQFVLWRVVEDRDAANAAKRDWAGALSRSCDDLLLAPGSGGAGTFDAKRLLEEAWPCDGTAEDLAVAGYLRQIVNHPDLYLLGDRDGSAVLELWSSGVDRLIPMLQVLRSLAQRAEAAWAKEVKRGGTDPDSPRLLLMCKLAGHYRTMFGRLPTVSDARRCELDPKRDTVPGGPSLEWFRALFIRVGEVCRGRPPETGDGCLAHFIIGELCDRARGVREAGTTQTRDALAGWIRSATRKLKEVEASQATRPSIPKSPD